MGSIRDLYKVRLFVAMMYRPGFAARSVTDILTAAYGAVDASFGPIEFSWSEYYSGEMGEGLKKVYHVFKDPIDRGLLPQIKNHTNGIERDFAVDGKRVVNIDPGYLSRDKLVLASTKDFYHRVYIGDGIFGEPTLHYRQGMFRFFSWTYPDYMREDFYAFLEEARKALFAGG